MKLRNHDYRRSPSDLEQYDAAGGLIITGEYVASAGSSLARLLLLPVNKNDVNNSILYEFQEKPIVAEFMKEFIPYITSKSEHIISYIKNGVKIKRDYFRGMYAHSRYEEYRAKLEVASEILIGYLLNKSIVDNDTAKKLLKQYNYCIEQAMIYNSMRIVENDPCTILSKAVLYAIEEEIYHVVPVGGKRGESKLIFEDNDYYYIHPKDLLCIFNLYRRQYDMLEREYKSANLINMLCDEGIATRTYEGKTLRNTIKIPRAGNIRYVQLYKQKIKTFAGCQA